MASTSVPNELAASDVLDVLDHLALKGLVLPEGSRFRFLESVRDFATELATDEEVEKCRSAHFAYYSDVSRNAEGKVRGPDQKTWLHFFKQEWENFRVALDWGFRNSARRSDALEMLYDLTPYMFIKGAFGEAVSIYDEALNHLASAPPDLKSRVFRRAGLMGIYHRDTRTQEWLSLAMEHAKEAEDEALFADALYAYANFLFMGGRTDEAIPFFEESLEKFRAQSDIVGNGFALARLGAINACRGNFEKAQKYLDECLVLRREHGDTRGIGAAFTLLADLALKQGEIDSAKRWIVDGLSLFVEMQTEQDFADCLPRAGWIAMLHGDMEVAARFLGFADARTQTLGTIRDPIDEADYQRVRGLLVDAFEPGQFEKICREGKYLSMDQVMDLVRQNLA